MFIPLHVTFLRTCTCVITYYVQEGNAFHIRTCNMYFISSYSYENIIYKDSVCTPLFYSRCIKDMHPFSSADTAYFLDSDQFKCTYSCTTTIFKLLITNCDFLPPVRFLLIIRTDVFNFAVI